MFISLQKLFKKNIKKEMEKKDLLKDVVKHIDIKKIDSTEIINAMRDMSFASRETANAADIYEKMIEDKKY